MAFVGQNLSMLSQINEASPWSYTYNSGADAIATVIGANYFSLAAFNLRVGDIIYVVAQDVNSFITVTAVDTTVFPATITTSEFDVSGSVGTANIVNAAVTTAKIANLAVTTGLIAANAVTSANIATGVLQVATGTLSAANWAAMYATPVQILAATVAGAGNYIEVLDFSINYIYVSAAYAAGGVVGLQYGTTAHLAAAPATATLSPTGFTDQTASHVAKIGGALVSTASTAVSDVGVYISNATAAFTTGDGTFAYAIAYRVLPVL